MDTSPMCLICGQEREDAYHALIRCPHARGLWHAMRQDWDIPEEDWFLPSGPEWILHALREMTELQRAMVLKILWRIWHVHNELTHQKPPSSIEGSHRFLLSYVDTLPFIDQHPHADFAKGKNVVSYSQGTGRARHHMDGRQKIKLKWKAPAEGVAKLDTMSDGAAGAGMVLHDHLGAVQ